MGCRSGCFLAVFVSGMTVLAISGPFFFERLNGKCIFFCGERSRKLQTHRRLETKLDEVVGLVPTFVERTLAVRRKRQLTTRLQSVTSARPLSKLSKNFFPDVYQDFLCTSASSASPLSALLT